MNISGNESTVVGRRRGHCKIEMKCLASVNATSLGSVKFCGLHFADRFIFWKPLYNVTFL